MALGAVFVMLCSAFACLMFADAGPILPAQWLPWLKDLVGLGILMVPLLFVFSEGSNAHVERLRDGASTAGYVVVSGLADVGTWVAVGAALFVGAGLAYSLLQMMM